jgi:TRAP-type mannitol/chloroaromatic compound transport system substrate-binding protein
MKNRVYVLSLNRVATQSTQDFLIRLGYDCMHWGGFYVNPKIGNLFSIEEMKELILTYEDQWNAFTDIPYNTMYEEFYVKHPDAKFIMLTRSAEKWRDSLKAVYQNAINQDPTRVNLDIYDKMLFWKYLDKNPTVLTDVSDDDYLTVHKRHTEAVLDFFKDKSNLLVLELGSPDIEWKIIEFLDMPYNGEKLEKIDKMKTWKWTPRQPNWID